MVSDNFKVEVFKQETDKVFMVLLTFSHESLVEDIRVCDDPYELLPIANVRGVVSNGDEYLFYPFEITLPQDDSTGVISAKLTIDNVERSIIGSLRSISTPVDVFIQVVMSSDPDYVERSYEGFKLGNVQYDAFAIEGNLSMDFWGLEPFPSGRFNRSGFPGLF